MFEIAVTNHNCDIKKTCISNTNISFTLRIKEHEMNIWHSRTTAALARYGTKNNLTPAWIASKHAQGIKDVQNEKNAIWMTKTP